MAKKTKRKKIVGWRVERKHVKPLRKVVNEFLTNLDYKLYGKNKTKNKKRKISKGDNEQQQTIQTQ